MEEMKQMIRKREGDDIWKERYGSPRRINGYALHGDTRACALIHNILAQDRARVLASGKLADPCFRRDFLCQREMLPRYLDQVLPIET